MFKIQEPIAVANLIIETAKKNHLDVNNLHLQKALFFAQGFFIDKYGFPLFDGTFVRWQYGPYELAVYDAFRDNGSASITSPALDIYKDKKGYFHVDKSKITDLGGNDQKVLVQIIIGLLHFTGWQLWDMIKTDKTFANYKELTNDYKAPDYTNRDIVECYRRNEHQLLAKISSVTENHSGEYTVTADDYDHTVTLSYVKHDMYRVHEYDNGTIVLIPIGD